jgi:hypothetical protein
MANGVAGVRPIVITPAIPEERKSMRECTRLAWAWRDFCRAIADEFEKEFTKAWQWLIRLTGQIEEYNYYDSLIGCYVVSRWFDSFIGRYQSSEIELWNNGSLVIWHYDNFRFPITPGWTVRAFGGIAEFHPVKVY